MRAGVLIVDIAANVARLQKDMQDAKGVVASAMGDIQRSVNVAKTALAALGVGLSVDYFVGLARSTIDAMDKLNDLSKATSLTVEQLAGLKLAAKQSGSDLDSIAQAVNKLSVNIGKEPEKFKALGIAAKEPLEALKQLADLYGLLQDPQQRAAVAAAALGKSWAGTAPLLAEGGAKIDEMVKRGMQLSGVTKEAAEQADEFNDKLAELNTTLGSTTTQLVSRALPGMNDIAQAMAEAAKEGGLLYTVWVGLGGAMAHLLNMADDQKARKRLVSVDEQLSVARKQLAAGTLNPQGASSDFFNFLIPDVKLGEQAIGRLRQTIGELEAERDRLLPKPGAKPERAAIDPVAAALAAARAKAFLDEPKKPTGKTLADILNEGVGVSKDFAQDLQTLHAAFSSGRLTLEEYQAAVGKLIDKQAFAKDLARAQAEETKRLVEQAQRQVEAQEAQNKILADFNTLASTRAQELELETSLIGASAAEREKAVELRKIDLALERAMVEATPETVDALYERAAAEKARLGALIDTKVAREESQKAADQAAEEWKRAQESMWQSIDRTAHDTFVSIFDSGKNAFDRLKDALKNGLYDLLYQMTLRPFVIQIAAALTGSTVAGAALAGGGGVGGGGGGGIGLGQVGDIFNLGQKAFNLLGNGLGGGTLGAIGAGLTDAGSLAGIDALAGLGAMGETAGVIAGAEVGLGGLAAGAASALPYVGLALGVAKIAGIGPFKKKKKKKPADMYLQRDASGRWFIWGDDVPGPSAREDFSYLEDALNDPLQYDPAILATFEGKNFRGGVGERADTLLPKFLQSLEPARQAAQATVSGWQAKLVGAGALQSSIAGYVSSMSVSEYLSPEQRLAGARTLYDEALAKAGAGDLAASQALPGFAQGLLGAGRDVYASGGQFQDLFTRVNSDMARVMQQQAEIQANLLAEMPISIREGAADTIAAIKRQTEELTKRLDDLNRGLRGLGGMVTPAFGGV